MTPEGGTGPGPGDVPLDTARCVLRGTGGLPADEGIRARIPPPPVSPRGGGQNAHGTRHNGSARAALEPHPVGRTTMPRLRSDGPCFWATWLTRLLSGEDSCDWAAWFRAHYEDGSWRQMPSDLDRVGWQMAHTAAVIAARARWEAWATLCTPRTELLRPERGIRQPGRPAGHHRPQAGIARHHRREDREGPPPVVQVMLYMYAVPRCIEEHRGVAFRGQVAYPAAVVDIPARRWTGSSPAGCPSSCGNWGTANRPGGYPAPWSAPTAPSSPPQTGPNGCPKAASRRGSRRTSESRFPPPEPTSGRSGRAARRGSSLETGHFRRQAFQEMDARTPIDVQSDHPPRLPATGGGTSPPEGRSQ